MAAGAVGSLVFAGRTMRFTLMVIALYFLPKRLKIRCTYYTAPAAAALLLLQSGRWS